MPRSSFLGSVPLLVIPLVVYNAVVLGAADSLDRGLLSIGLFSGAQWTLTLGSAIVIAGLVLLYIEILKSTRTSRAAVADTMMSFGVFAIFLVEFIVVARAGTSTFFMLLLMSAIDVLAGFQITVSAARRDIDVEKLSGT